MKWSRPGYHVIILADGTTQQLSPYELPTNGVKDHNANSIHISFIGGVDKNQKPVDNRTDAQKATMLKLVTDLMQTYPKAKVLGHRDFPGVKKACPSFSVAGWLKEVGLAK